MAFKAVYVTDLAESQHTDNHPFQNCVLNTGNLLFYKSIVKTTGLPVMTRKKLMDPALSEKPDTIVTSDLIWIGKNSDLPNLYDIRKKFGDKIKIIPLCVGLDYAYTNEFSFSEDMKYFLKSISEQCDIACRGEYVAEELNKIGIHNTTILGCPSLYYNENPDFQIFTKELPEVCRVSANATLWATKDKASAQDLKKFVIFCIKNNAEFIEQTITNGFGLDCKPEISIGGFMDWRWRWKYFFEAKPWIEYMRRFDFVIGGRFHGCVAGILANVPTLVLNYDKRVEELCRYFKIPLIQFKDFDSSKPVSYYYEKTDYSLFNEGFREKYNKYFDYLKNNQIYTKEVK